MFRSPRPLSLFQRRPLFERHSKKRTICLDVCDRLSYCPDCPDLYQSTVVGIGHQRNNPSPMCSKLDPQNNTQSPKLRETLWRSGQRANHSFGCVVSCCRPYDRYMNDLVRPPYPASSDLSPTLETRKNITVLTREILGDLKSTLVLCSFLFLKTRASSPRQQAVFLHLGS